MGLITLSDLKDQQTLVKKLNRKCCCANGSIENGCCYYEVTRAEIELLVTNGDLIKGALYKITDRGDLGLWFEAISNTELNPEGVRKMLVPAGADELGYNSTTGIGFPDTFGNIWHGVWHTNIGTVNEGDLVIWGGLVWQRAVYPIDGSACDIENPCGIGFECVDGFCIAENNVGTKVDDTTLSAEWVLIPKDSFTNHEYMPKLFGVYYDFENDWISRQWDEKGNIFGIEFNHDLPIGFNPVDISDWNWSFIGSITNSFHENQCIGIWNNPNNGGSTDHAGISWNHLINGSIIENVIGGSIEFNTNKGNIEGNTCTRSIINNSNAGNIIYNLGDFYQEGLGYVADIMFNDNLGDISNNTNWDNIAYNSNHGSIETNSNGDLTHSGTIEYNSNRGTISDNSNIGVISFNANNGAIFSCTSTPNACDIKYNINNGQINGAYVADVSDAIVNK